MLFRALPSLVCACSGQPSLNRLSVNLSGLAFAIHAPLALDPWLFATLFVRPPCVSTFRVSLLAPRGVHVRRWAWPESGFRRTESRRHPLPPPTHKRVLSLIARPAIKYLYAVGQVEEYMLHAIKCL